MSYHKNIVVHGKEISVNENVYEPCYVQQDDSLFNLPLLNDCENILEIGTGTGILPIMWKEYFPELKITAFDIYEGAVKNAISNINNNLSEEQIRDINVEKSNLFDALDKEKFDAIIFNGPHIKDPNENDKNKLGDHIYKALYDEGLETAKSFFRDVQNHLEKDGFIIYTFSEYGPLNELFEIIIENKLAPTFLSVVPFVERDPVQLNRLKDKNYEIWYNILIQRPTDISHDNFVKGYRNAVISISNLFNSVNSNSTFTKDNFKEYSEIIKRIVEQLFKSSKHFINSNNWFIGGLSYPKWSGNNRIYELIPCTNFSSEEEEELKRESNYFVKLIQDHFKDDEIQLLVNYLAKSKEYDIIEATSSNDFFSDYIKSSKKVIFKLNVPGKEKSNNFDNNQLADYLYETVKKYEDDFKNIADIADKEDNPKKTFPISVLRNLWLNLYFISCNNVPMEYIRFIRINYPTAPISGTVYFFCSFNPYDKVELANLINNIEEVVRIANDVLQVPIWVRIRNDLSIMNAVSAIMARNMSHNIGSHVLTRSEVGDIEKRLKKLYNNSG